MRAKVDIRQKKKFKITPFTQNSKVHRRVGRNRTLVIEISKLKEVDAKRTVGRVNLQWPKKNGLNEKLHSFEFVKRFLLTKENNLSGKRKSMLEK